MGMQNMETANMGTQNNMGVVNNIGMMGNIRIVGSALANSNMDMTGNAGIMNNFMGMDENNPMNIVMHDMGMNTGIGSNIGGRG